MDALLCAFAFNYHDSSVAVARGREVLLVLEAERVFRRKRLSASPEQMAELINMALREVSATADEVTYWATTALHNPWVRGVDWSSGRELTEVVIDILGRRRQCLIVGHHRSHAASYYLSGLDRALISTCDGGGDDGQLSGNYLGQGLRLERMDEGDRPPTVTGLLYRHVSDFLFGTIHCEGRLMALAAFDEPDQQLVADLAGLHGALRPFDVEHGFALLEKLLGDRHGQAVREPLAVTKIAASLQTAFENGRVADLPARCTEEIDGSVLAGGACLNIGANRRIFESGRGLPYIAPCCDDTGQALGALLELIVQVSGERPTAHLPYTGLGAGRYPAPDSATIDTCAEHVARGGIVLAHNGAAEIGPRALGHRSFLARASSTETKRVLSQEVKQREWYRPVAPVVREADCRTYFTGPSRSDYMLFSFDVRPSWRGELVGCVHADGSARVQTIPEGGEPFLEALLDRYGECFGPPVLLNTSLNLRGEPLANDIDDTAAILRRMPVDAMLVHDGRIVAP